MCTNILSLPIKLINYAWTDGHRVYILISSVMHAQFSQNPHLKQELLSTAGTTLVEASPRDRIWGIGLGANNPKALDRKTWRGTNWLGQALTEVREEIMSNELSLETSSD